MIVNFLNILIKLALGLISLVFVINVTGKGNLAPNSAVDQIQNFVLGGIIGGVIYNSSITILQYIVILLMWTILILLLKWLNTNVRFMKHLIDGKPTVIIKNGKTGSGSVSFQRTFCFRCCFETTWTRDFSIKRCEARCY